MLKAGKFNTWQTATDQGPRLVEVAQAATEVGAEEAEGRSIVFTSAIFRFRRAATICVAISLISGEFTMLPLSWNAMIRVCQHM